MHGQPHIRFKLHNLQDRTAYLRVYSQSFQYNSGAPILVIGGDFNMRTLIFQSGLSVTGVALIYYKISLSLFACCMFHP